MAPWLPCHVDVEDLRRSWSRLALADPLWAVYVAPGRRHGRWDTAEFLATGAAEVARSFQRLDELGVTVVPGTALDFGCGVGRLSNALAERFEHVLAVDVAEPMLERARSLDRSGGRITWLHNAAPDLALLPDRSVDLVYSSLVLQHLPRPLATAYLREFVRVLRPGGLAVVQVASRPTASVRGLAFRVLPPAVVGWLQRVVLRYPAPMLMAALDAAGVARAVAGTGAEVLDVTSDETYGGHWEYERVVLRAT